MRCNPWRWLWGVIPIAMLSWLAFTWERDGIETELRSRAELALQSDGYGWGRVKMDGRDAMLRGEAPDDAQPYRAVETVRSVRGVRIVRHRTDLKSNSDQAVAAAPTPSAEAVERPATADVDVRETGRSEDTAGEIDRIRRAELEDAWRRAEEHERQWRAEREVQALAQPAPEGAAEAPAAEETRPVVEDLDRAELERRWRLAEDEERAWKASRGETTKEPAAESQPAPVVEELDRAALEQQWRLAEEAEQRWKAEGLAAADAERQRAEAEAAEKAAAETRARAEAEEEARRKEDERLQVEAEAEAQRIAEEQAAAEAKRKAEEAAAAEARRQAEEAAAAEARRKAEDEEQARLKAEAEAKRKDDVEVAARKEQEAVAAKAKAEADRCQGLMRSAMAEGVINFDTARADLTRDSFQTLDRLAGIVKACPSAHITIAGHTDSQGLEERNQMLSERRAKSVADYLTQKGVDPQRLSASGFGETKPIAPNDTPDGMAQNRRIEFNVEPQQ